MGMTFGIPRHSSTRPPSVLRIIMTDTDSPAGRLNLFRLLLSASGMPKTTWPKKPPHRTGECCGYAPSTKLKRFETVKAFFSFCVSRDRIAKDSARAVKVPKVRHIPTLPFSDAEIEKLLWAVDTFREIHSQILERLLKGATGLCPSGTFSRPL